MKGFILPVIPIQIWVYLAIGMAFLLTLGYARLQTARLETAQTQLAIYKAEGERAKKEAEAKDFVNRKAKESADAENKRSTDSLKRTIASLRKSAVTSGGSVSANPANSQCPESLVCYSKSEYQRAYGDFVEEIRGLADEGSQVSIDMNTAREWAGNIK